MIKKWGLRELVLKNYGGGGHGIEVMLRRKTHLKTAERISLCALNSPDYTFYPLDTIGHYCKFKLGSDCWATVLKRIWFPVEIFP